VDLNRSKKIKKEKMMKKKIAVIALGVMAVLVAGQEAGASSASWPTADVVLNWNTFSVQLEPGMDLVMSGQKEGNSAYADGDVDSHSGLGWTDNVPNSVASGSYAKGESNNLLVSAYSMLNLDEAGSAWANAYRSAQFTVTGTGELSVSIDYSWHVTLADEQSGTQFSQASCYIKLSDLIGSDYRNSIGELSSTDNMLFKDRSGKLNLNLYITDGATLNFEANASAKVEAAPVPVPPALWLLGSGVFGLLARKKKNLA
jgi:hypothetical protein